jgi:hypothetical protein
MARAAKGEHDPLKAHAASADLRLTDLEMGTEYAVAGLELVAGDLDQWEEPVTIDIRSNKGETITISKTRSQFEEILTEQINRKQYEKSLVFAVAEVEDHIASYIHIILRAHPDRLTRGPRGGPSGKSVSLIDFIEIDREAIINSRIEESINSIMYKQPKEYLEYLGQVIGRQLSDDVVKPFCEVCATRDLLVHNQGKINSKYIDKAGRFARGAVGDFVVVDEKYFKSSMANFRSIYEEIYTAICGEFGKTIRFLPCSLSSMEANDALRGTCGRGPRCALKKGIAGVVRRHSHQTSARAKRIFPPTPAQRCENPKF